jgi:aromatic-L-amino-acid decarboxylase
MAGPTTDELRAELHRAADWAADFLEQVGELPVYPQVKPGEVAASLPQHPPAAGEPLSAMIDDVDRLIVPGLTHWNHPGFLAYFANTGSAPGILAEMMAATLNVNAMLWQTSPAATELEQVVLAWSAELVGLPDGLFGQITDSASTSTFTALAAAREAADIDVRDRGLAGRPDLPALRVYASGEAHSSVEKGCIALGLGRDGFVPIGVDSEYRMRVDELSAAIDADIAAGHRPIAVVATVGTTSSTSIDPVGAIADVCARNGLWLHVDAAYGGAAAVVPELRWVLRDCERADSIVINPHKWMLVPMDCSLLWTSRPEQLRAAFSLVPEYLRTGQDEVVNLMDYGLTLGRRFRALKLWMVLRAYGAEGMAEVIGGHVRLARLVESWIDATPGWELLAPVPFSTVNFRYHPAGVDDEDELRRLNQAILSVVNGTGEVYLSHTQLGGRFAIHLAIGNGATGEQHVARAWTLLQAAAG